MCENFVDHLVPNVRARKNDRFDSVQKECHVVPTAAKKTERSILSRIFMDFNKIKLPVLY